MQPKEQMPPNRIRQYRRSCTPMLNQTQLGEALGKVHRNTISAWESKGVSEESDLLRLTQFFVARGVLADAQAVQDFWRDAGRRGMTTPPELAYLVERLQRGDRPTVEPEQEDIPTIVARQSALLLFSYRVYALAACIVTVLFTAHLWVFFDFGPACHVMQQTTNITLFRCVVQASAPGWAWVRVTEGDEVAFAAHGLWTVNWRDKEGKDRLIGPEGYTDRPPSGPAKETGAAYAALIAEVEGYGPFPVGAARTISAPFSGRLALRINDYSCSDCSQPYGDNQGEMEVTIMVWQRQEG